MSFKIKTVKNLILSLCFGLLTAGGGFWIGRYTDINLNSRSNQSSVDRTQPVTKTDLNMNMFWQVWDRLENYYFEKEKIDSQQIIWGAVKGLTSSLGDPYTVFLPPKDNQRSKEDLNGAFEGVGIELGYKDNTLAVVAPLSGTPAEKAGLKAGDLILNIKDELKDINTNTLNMSLPEAVEIIRGTKGTPVVFTILHQNEQETVEIEVTRGTIIVPSVELEWLADDLPYLKLSRFGDRTSQEWQTAVNKVVSQCHQQNCSGLILDLRNNPGGYLESAVSLASEFISDGTVVKQENANGSIETYSVNRQGQLINMPVVVLINQGSASSSEILAGSLKVRRQAVLVGQPSFGKGTIQEAQELKNGAGLHITTARWLLPDNTWVNDQPLEPDHLVEDNIDTEEDEQLLKAQQVLKGEVSQTD